MNITIQLLVRRVEKILIKTPFLANFYMRSYKQVVQNEITLAHITNDDTVLNIGCGAAPFTAIYLALLSKAKVCAIDKDSKAIDMARIYCKKIGFENQITFIKANGIKLIPVNFTVAIISLQAAPKQIIFDNMLKTITPGGRLIFRKSSKKFENYYDYLPKSIPFVKMVKQNMKTFDSSVLYLK